MKISVFGLGYVGCVSAACFAQEGHEVVGVDVSQTKIDLINAGQSPIIEKDLDTILAKVASGGTGCGTLRATQDSSRAVAETDLSLICVGTPSDNNGSLRLDYVKQCARDVGAGLKDKDRYHVIVVRSTMLPGSVEEAVIKEVEYTSGKRAGEDFGVAINPEFLRESTSIHDFYNPPMTIIGQFDERSGDTVAKIYDFLDAPLVRTEIRVAEMIKYSCNAFHAVKVAFGNEIGAMAKAIGIDSHKVMDIFCMDDKLNLSSYYLKPGFAFGGSCLPKDLRAINYKARTLDVDTPLLNSVLPANEVHVARSLDVLLQSGTKKVGILGLSFKAGTDDLRESPLVTIAEALIGKGYDLKIYDKNISMAKLVGANKEYIEREIPHISSLLCDSIEEVMDNSDIVVIGNKSEEFIAAVENAPADKRVYDLCRITKETDALPDGYEGVCW